jgi:hypothetical protein
MAQVLIYDYAASFKRIDVKSPVKVSYKEPGESARVYGLDSPKVVSDKFTGYMVIESCENCGGSMIWSSEEGRAYFGNPAVVYIKRNSNKNAVYRAIGRFEAAMFGAKAGVAHVKDSHGEIVSVLVNPSKFTDALGFLSYNINANGNVSFASGAKVNGFLGVGHVGMTVNYPDWWDDMTLAYNGLPEHWLDLKKGYDAVDHAGFGKVKVLKTELDCLDEQSCYVVKDLAGSMIGSFLYAGYCSDFLVDVCFDTAYDLSNVAPISGTFTLKLNNKLTFSNKEYKNNTFAEAETAIEKAFGTATKYADPIETEQFNWWLAEVLLQPALKDYYYWYSVSFKGALINAKNDYKAIAGLLADKELDVKKVTKVEIVDSKLVAGAKAIKVTYVDSTDTSVTLQFTEWGDFE